MTLTLTLELYQLGILAWLLIGAGIAIGLLVANEADPADALVLLLLWPIMPLFRFNGFANGFRRLMPVGLYLLSWTRGRYCVDFRTGDIRGLGRPNPEDGGDQDLEVVDFLSQRGKPRGRHQLLVETRHRGRDGRYLRIRPWVFWWLAPAGLVAAAAGWFGAPIVCDPGRDGWYRKGKAMRIGNGIWVTDWQLVDRTLESGQ